MLSFDIQLSGEQISSQLGNDDEEMFVFLEDLCDMHQDPRQFGINVSEASNSYDTSHVVKWLRRFAEGIEDGAQ